MAYSQHNTIFKCLTLYKTHFNKYLNCFCLKPGVTQLPVHKSILTGKVNIVRSMKPPNNIKIIKLFLNMYKNVGTQ